MFFSIVDEAKSLPSHSSALWQKGQALLGQSRPSWQLAFSIHAFLATTVPSPCKKCFENKTLRGFIGPWCFCIALHASTPYTWRDVHSMKSQCQSLRLCGCSDILKSHKPADQSSIYQKLRKTSAACLFKPLLQSGMPDGKQLLSNKTHPWSCLGHNWLSFKYFLVCYLSIKEMSCKDHGSAGTVRRCL